MYSDDYDDNEEETSQSSSGIQEFYNNNKKLVWILGGIIVFVLFAWLFTSCGSSSVEETPPEPPEITLNPEVLPVEVGYSDTIKATVTSDTNPKIEWKSDNPAIAKVDSNGRVTGVSLGTTNITAFYKYKGNDSKEHVAEKTCVVMVGEGNQEMKLTGISFGDGDLLISKGNTYSELDSNLIKKPSNGYVSKKEYHSSDSNVVSIDEEGVIEAIKEGNATITVKVNDTYEANIDVYVLKENIKTEIITNPKDINFTKEVEKIKIGDEVKLSYKYTPNDASTKYLTFSSNDETIVTVNSIGEIKGLKKGTATITVETINKHKDSILIEVEESIIDVASISVPMETINIYVDGSYSLVPTVTPADASNKALSYTVDNASIASVQPSQGGTSATVYGLAQGRTTITIKSNNNVTKQVTVVVTGGSSQTSPPSYYEDPCSPSNKGYKIDSSTKNVVNTYNASLDSKEIKAGPSTITFTSLNGGNVTLRVCDYIHGKTKCNPDTDGQTISGTGQYTINGDGVHDILIKEVGKNCTLTYYMNLSGSSSSESESSSDGFTVTGGYNSREEASKDGNKITSTQKSFTVSNLTGKVKSVHYCVAKAGSLVCIDGPEISGTKSIRFDGEGEWKVFFRGYDSSGNKVSEIIRYITVGTNTSSTESTPTTMTITAGAPRIATAMLVGKYIILPTSSSQKFNHVIACVGLNGSSCNLNKNLPSISGKSCYNGSYYKPYNSGTCYMYFPETYSKDFWFDIDALDEWNNGNLSRKEIVFEYAVFYNNTAQGFTSNIPVSKTVKLRIKNNDTTDYTKWSIAIIN